MKLTKIGVVGCGLMGSGITQVCAQSGYQVVVSEVKDELLNKGLASINSRLTKGVEQGRLSAQDKDLTMARIKGTINTGDFADCDLVVEAATENIDIKKKIFAELGKVCPGDTILVTNTSVLSVIDIAMVTARADKVLGLHFFNPVPVMQLVEVIKTIATSEDTLVISIEFVKSLGKRPVITHDAPGFIVNRILTPFLLSAIRMLENGVATREDIDTAINLGLNHPIGPLKLLDLIGIDTVFNGASGIYEETKDPQYAPPPLMKKMITAGWLGRKTGKGFYDYE